MNDSLGDRMKHVSPSIPENIALETMARVQEMVKKRKESSGV